MTLMPEPVHPSSAQKPGSQELLEGPDRQQDEAFVELYRREMPGLMRFLMRLGADTHTAADMTQAAFLDAYQNKTSILKPAAWLRSVVQRSYFRQVRQQERLTPTDQVPDTAHLPPDPLELAEGQYTVLAALASLPPKQRLVMAWHLDGYRHEEIASYLQMSPESVRQNLHRARDHLKTKLQDQLPLQGRIRYSRGRIRQRGEAQ